MEMREKNQSDIIYKLLLGNVGNNEENNCKPDHNRLELLCHWLVKDV
jgi:hypothetical protein